MSLKFVTLVTVACLFCQFDLIMQGGPSGDVPQRNLALYDRVGLYTINYEPPYKGDKYLAEIRMFLWQHWIDHRLGLVTATFFSIEGDPTASTFFVEPAGKDEWVVRVHSNRTVVWSKRRKPRREKTREEYDEIERVEPTSANAATPAAIPQAETREPQMFRLRLRNSKTKSVRIL